LSWPESYAAEPRFNPWPIKYLLPAVKWFPLYWPNADWEVVSFPPAFDEFGNRLASKPPDSAIIPWWKMPKDQWPIEAPWAGKVFGAWPASQITMSEDLPPSIWPGGHRTPPFGFIKIKMPGTPDVTGNQLPTGNQIPFTHMKIYMRPYLGPIHHMKIMTRVNALGETKFYMIDKNWEQHEYEVNQYRAALRARKREQVEAMLVEIIASGTKGEPKPSKDLFE
jgi:hypothetical protein